jgi:hypothetical protein
MTPIAQFMTISVFGDLYVFTAADMAGGSTSMPKKMIFKIS